MTKIFVSYQRADTADYAKRLFDKLSVDFGSDAVFVDVATIAPGAKFAIVIENAVSKCDALLALIGPKWGFRFDSKSPPSPLAGNAHR